MEIVSEVTFKTFRFMLGPFGAILSHFWSYRKRSRTPMEMASYSYSETWSQGKLKLDPMHLTWSN